ncbi:hypothetical protein [uncultured Helicobacter sp.]|uniref:hypothetical protein n=1 Tax=uncultured Helicobacter sp. TaxID=175537 RepID=UPI00375028F4
MRVYIQNLALDSVVFLKNPCLSVIASGTRCGNRADSINQGFGALAYRLSVQIPLHPFATAESKASYRVDSLTPFGGCGILNLSFLRAS